MGKRKPSDESHGGPDRPDEGLSARGPERDSEPSDKTSATAAQSVSQRLGSVARQLGWIADVCWREICAVALASWLQTKRLASLLASFMRSRGVRQEDADWTVDALWPSDGIEQRRVVIGYASVLILLSLVVWRLVRSDPILDANAVVKQLESHKAGIRKTTDEVVASVNLADRDLKEHDDVLASLRGLPDLEELDLENTKITDDDLVHLRELKKLDRLYLWNTDTSDAGLEHVAELAELRYLNLTGTKVTNAGLQRLKGLKNLEQLYLEETAVTELGAKDLQLALPYCRITR